MKKTTYPDGNTYLGELKNGKHHGQGTYTWSGGNKYEGEFKDDKPNGQGTYTWSDGCGELREAGWCDLPT